MFVSKNPKAAAHHLAAAFELSDPAQTKPTQFDILLNLGSAAKLCENGLPTAVRALGDALQMKPEHAGCKKQLEHAQQLLSQQQPQGEQPGPIVITVPEGTNPGDVLTINLPNGQKIEYPVPPNGKPGDKITISPGGGEEEEEEGDTIAVVVPKGAKPGDEVEYDIDGDKVKITMPADCKEGDKIHLQASTSKDTLQVEVPEGMGPGDEFEVQIGPTKESVVKIKVPEGAKGGDKMTVRIA